VKFQQPQNSTLHEICINFKTLCIFNTNPRSGIEPSKKNMRYQIYIFAVLLAAMVQVKPAFSTTAPECTKQEYSQEPDGWTDAFIHFGNPDPLFYHTLDGRTPTSNSPSGRDVMKLRVIQDTTLKICGVDADEHCNAIQSHHYYISEFPAMTVYFKKPASWPAAKIYYWDPSPPDSYNPVSWPGVDMTQNQEDCDWYYHTFPEGMECTNLIFNSGSGDQTGDLYRCTEGYYQEGLGWEDTEPDDFCPVASPPTLSIDPPGGNCGLPSSITITPFDLDGDEVTICHTFDGSDPDPQNCIEWQPGQNLPTSDFTLKAIGVDATGLLSPVYSENYSSADLAPDHNIDPVGPRIFNPSISVSITATDDCSTPEIYFTLDGDDPDLNDNHVSNELNLVFYESTTLKYFVKDENGHTTPIETHEYTFDPQYGCGEPEADYFTWDNATVYFAVTDRFNDGDPSNNNQYGRGSDLVGGFHGGDLKGMTQKITDGYFDDLGINAIWITPPVEQIHGYVPAWGDDPDFNAHYAYHGYYALDWTELDANMGTNAEFQALVDTAHNHGIRVIMDVVLNHAGYDTPQDMAEFNWSDCTDWWSAEWIRKDDIDYCSPCGGGDLQSCLAGLPDIITEATEGVDLPPVLLEKWDATKESSEIAELDAFFANSGLPRTPVNHIIKWLTDWVQEYGIDAFRLDTYKHVELEHWGTLKQQAEIALAEWKSNHPDKKLDDLPFWMVGENYGSGIGKWEDAINIGLTDALINFNFQGQEGNFSTIDDIYVSYAEVANPDPEWNFLSYISSHDTQLSDRNTLIDDGTTLLMLPGVVQVFYGDETKRLPGPGPGDQPTRSDMNWGSIDTDVLTHWQKLGKFRKKHLSIGAGSHQKLSDSPYTFHRSKNTSNVQDQVVVVFEATGLTPVDVSSISTWPDGTELKDFYTGSTALVTGGTVSFTAGSEGVILIENPNPVIVPTLSMTPENNAFDPNGHQVLIHASSLDCDPVKTWYTLDLSADENDLSEWIPYYGNYIHLSGNSAIKAIAENEITQVRSPVLTHHYWTENQDLTVYFHNTDAWSPVYLYYWDCSPPSGSNETQPWPGILMSNVCGNWYSATLPLTTTCQVIFSCGSNSCQTADLSIDGPVKWYENGSWTDHPPASWCQAPAAPTNLTAEAGGPTLVYLNWVDNATDESGFILQRSSQSGTGFTTIATLDNNTTQYIDIGVEGGNTYFYRVKATNAFGDSSWSDEDNITTPLNCLPVSHTGDDGPGSLRNAIRCAGEWGSIGFDPLVFGETIALSSTPLWLDKSVEIIADPLNNISLSAQAISHLFSIREGKTLRFEGLKLYGGQGPLYRFFDNAGTLILKDIKFYDGGPPGSLARMREGNVEIEGIVEILEEE
jgi:glycosidase